MKLSLSFGWEDGEQNNHWQQFPHSRLESYTTSAGLGKEGSENISELPSRPALTPWEPVLHFCFGLPRVNPSLLGMEFATQPLLTRWSDLIQLPYVGARYLSVFDKMPQYSWSELWRTGALSCRSETLSVVFSGNVTKGNFFRESVFTALLRSYGAVSHIYQMDRDLR